jgi:hydroxymethylglutaryl-CoA lyase
VFVFTAATDAFTRTNTNIPAVSASLSLLEPVVHRTREHRSKVRGYLSVMLFCPYSGRVDPKRVCDITRALIDMGCYQVSLGDTVGMGTPESVREMLEVVEKDVLLYLLAVRAPSAFNMR